MLESRSLLTARRVGPEVKYCIGVNNIGNFNSGLVRALQVSFRRKREQIDAVYRLLTAFTHPRRREIFRILRASPLRVEELQRTSGIPTRALRRHLKKLEVRKFVRCAEGYYFIVRQVEALGRELARMACI